MITHIGVQFNVTNDMRVHAVCAFGAVLGWYILLKERSARLGWIMGHDSHV